MSELSREQVEEYTNRFHNCGFLHLKKVFDGHDAALRATIEQRDGQIEKLAAFIVLIPGEPSKSEGAVDTAIRIITQQAQELERLKERNCERIAKEIELYDKLAAMTRDRNTWNALCETAQEHRGTVAAQRDEFEQQLAAMTRERDELKYRLQVMADTVGEEDFSLRQQLAASQARCRDLEKLKLMQEHSIADECEAEQHLVDAGISDYEDGEHGEYRGLLTQIDLCIKERDAAVRDAQRYRYLRAHAAFDGSYKHRITWYLPHCYRDIPIKNQLDMDLDEAIRLA